MSKMTVEEIIANINKGFLDNNELNELSKKIASCNNVEFQVKCLRRIEHLPGRSEIVDVLAKKQPEDFSSPKEYENFLREMVQVNDIRLKPWFDKILSLKSWYVNSYIRIEKSI